MITKPLYRVNRELLDEAKRVFQPSDLVPTTNAEQAMFDAGVKRVLDWLDAKIKRMDSQTTVQSVDDPEDLPDSHETILRNLLAGDT